MTFVPRSHRRTLIARSAALAASLSLAAGPALAQAVQSQPLPPPGAPGSYGSSQGYGQTYNGQNDGQAYGAPAPIDQGANAQPVEGYNNTPTPQYARQVQDSEAPTPGHRGDKFTQNEVVQAAAGFFGATSEAVAKAVQKIFSEQGLPDAYIKGDEGSGAFIFGLRYGSGWLMRKGYEPVKVYWQSPSVGFDFGANASKTFMLIYNLRDREQLFQRFPGVDGSFYFIAGIGVNYLRAGNITIAPMRTGVGLRAGVAANYMTFTPDQTWNPF